MIWLAFALPVALYAAERKIIIGGAQSLTSSADKFSAQFRSRHPAVEIEVRRSNSNYAVHATRNGEIQIGLVTRNLSAAEKSEFYTKAIGQDAIIFLSHSWNSVTDLSLDQLRDIYLGKITNWRAVGGADNGIVPLTRETGSALSTMFVERLFGKGFNGQQKAFILRANKDKVLRTIKRIRGSLGYGIVRLEEAEAQGVKVLAINKILPTGPNLQRDPYPFTRPHLLITKPQPDGIVHEWLSGFAQFTRQIAGSRDP
jgi:phosphate transport system substrate-binding protein